MYTPAEIPLMSSLFAVNAPGPFHKKMYGAMPPLTVASTAPLLAPWQAAVVTIAVAFITGGSLNVTEMFAVQPLSSLTVAT